MKPISNAGFRLGLSCLQNLGHQRAGPPSTLGENSLRRLLAEGEGALDVLQRAIEQPFWVGLDDDASVIPAYLVEIKTAIAVVNRRGGCRSLYATTIAHRDFLVRIDLLRVHRDRLEVVEINPQSWAGPAPGLPLAEIVSQNGEEILSPWIACVQDLDFEARTPKSFNYFTHYVTDCFDSKIQMIKSCARDLRFFERYRVALLLAWTPPNSFHHS
ncbi:MAG: hypothetical protein ACKODK_09075 [Opitutaceae bacterium]